MKAARKAVHERVQQEIAARKAALIAQGITPESRSERKRRLAREAAERAARKAQGPRPAQGQVPAPSWPASQGFQIPAPRLPRDQSGPAQRFERAPERYERPARAPERVEPEPVRPAPQVAFRKRRRVAPPPDEK